MSIDGTRIRAAREAMGLTQAKLGERAGTTQQTVDRIERGLTLHSRAIPKIAEILNADEPLRTIGEHLNARRIQAGLSMDELARAMGFAGPSSIQRYLAPDYNLELRSDMARKFDGALNSNREERGAEKGSGAQADIEHLWARFVNHYWDCLEGDKAIVLKHIRSVLDYHMENS